MGVVATGGEDFWAESLVAEAAVADPALLPAVDRGCARRTAVTPPATTTVTAPTAIQRRWRRWCVPADGLSRIVASISRSLKRPRASVSASIIASALA